MRFLWIKDLNKFKWNAVGKDQKNNPIKMVGYKHLEQ